MAKRKRKLIMVTTGASALALAGVVGLTSVSAASMTNSTTRGARHQHRQQNYEKHLDAAVGEGKLTAAQEQAILAEEKKLHGEIKAAKTAAQRKAARETVRSEAQAWAKANNISGRWLLEPRRLRG